MQTYIALLRGINVSGQKPIKMADLKADLEALGLKAVQTYVQSGNVIFQTKKSPKSLATVIEKKILETRGFQVPILLRSPQELADILAGNPFPESKGKDPERLYVTFLSEEPAAACLKNLASIDYPPEEFNVQGKHIYFYSPNGYGKAKMNNQFFESKLKVVATTRNWKTVNALSAMAPAD